MTLKSKTEGQQGALSGMTPDKVVRVIRIATVAADSVIAAAGFYIAYLDKQESLAPVWVGQILMGVAAVSLLATWFIVIPTIRKGMEAKAQRAQTE